MMLSGEAMFATPAYAQAAGGGLLGGGGPMDMLVQFLPIVALVVLFYFLMIRPQQQRMKQHREMVANISRGDTVVTAGGHVAKVSKPVKPEDPEITVEIADGVHTQVVRSTISEVRPKNAPANSNKAA
jgi:preprotein translocase subunit YajC